MKVCEVCGDEISTRDGENRCPNGCQVAKGVPQADKKAKARRQRQARDEVMRSLGLVKVRGAMGGTYWE